MTTRDTKEQMSKKDADNGNSTETHSGNPNPVDPNKHRTNEHKSGYGGEGGEPRESSEDEQRH